MTNEKIKIIMNNKIEDILDVVVDTQTADKKPQASWGANNVGWTRKQNTTGGFRVFELRLPPVDVPKKKHVGFPRSD